MVDDVAWADEERLPDATGAWRVKLVCAWRDDAVPDPISAITRSKATRLGMRLSCEPDFYVARFLVAADGLAHATRLVFAKWSTLVSKAGLPSWELVSLEVLEIDPTESDLSPLRDIAL